MILYYQDVCICKYYKIIDLIFLGLVKLIFSILNCSDSFLDSVVCSYDEVLCIDGVCLKCGDMKSVF